MVRDLDIRPGQTFYAVNEQTLNTDTPAPVATIKILSGPLKDSIAEGTFELSNFFGLSAGVNNVLFHDSDDSENAQNPLIH